LFLKFSKSNKLMVNKILIIDPQNDFCKLEEPSTAQCQRAQQNLDSKLHRTYGARLMYLWYLDK